MADRMMKVFVLCLALYGLLTLRARAEADAKPEIARPKSARELYVPRKIPDLSFYLKLYHKHYPSVVKATRRAKLILARMYEAFKSKISYSKGESPSYIDVNEFSDNTDEELARMYKSGQSSDFETIHDVQSQLEQDSFEALLDRKLDIDFDQHITRADENALSELVEHYDHIDPKDPANLLPDQVFLDHRKSNCLTEPKSQGLCGSCYAFATIALLEWMHCKQLGNLVEFSEQYMVDCGVKTKLDGCNGGSKINAIKFVHYFGLELAKNYPYRAKSYQCPYPIETGLPNNLDPSMGFIRPKMSKIQLISLNNLESELRESPLQIDIGVGWRFPFYAGGVEKPKDCGNSERGHSMVLVGHGREDNREYWLLRNSHGINWGQGGYYKLDKTANCWIHRIAQKIQGQFAKSNPKYNGTLVKDHVATLESISGLKLANHADVEQAVVT